jgi:hypothetical protein
MLDQRAKVREGSLRRLRNASQSPASLAHIAQVASTQLIDIKIEAFLAQRNLSHPSESLQFIPQPKHNIIAQQCSELRRWTASLPTPHFWSPDRQSREI